MQVGVGKTMIINSLLEALPQDRAAMTINFSAQTSSNSLQVRTWAQSGLALGLPPTPAQPIRVPGEAANKCTYDPSGRTVKP